jgi:hypothetical protein
MSWRPQRLTWVVVAATLVLASGCGGGGDETSTDESATGATSSEESSGGEPGGGDEPATIDPGTPIEDLGEVLADVESIDRRPAVLSELGGPDAFVITVDEVGGTVSRLESWTYFSAQTQIDFIDGELLWDIEIEPLAEGAWLPRGYSPVEFTMLASVDDTLASLTDVDLQPVEAVTDFEVEGAELWAGEQLALGFIDDRLIYVETFPLAPGEQEVVG